MSHFDKTMGVRKANLIIHNIQITDSVVRHKAEALTVSLPSTSYTYYTINTLKFMKFSC